MKNKISVALFVLIYAVAGCNISFADTRVKMRGDAFVLGSYIENRNFTGWNKTGTKSSESFEIWERFRLRADFEANKNVYFRLGLRVINTWGYGTFTAANPSAEVLVDLAYLQFKIPDSNVTVTAGKQDINLPQSSIFNGSLIFCDAMTALTVDVPVVENMFSVRAGFARLFDSSRTYDETTTQKADEMDGYFLTLPVTVDGFKATPWAMVTVAGRNGPYSTYKNTADVADSGTNFANTLLSPASYVNIASTNGLGYWKNSQNIYYWVGSSFDVSVLDPVRFYADIIYAAGAMNDNKAARRQGLFADASVEYTGLAFAKPMIFGWYGTGEDNSIRNGSERLPYLRSKWGAGNTLIFEDDSDLPRATSIYVSPVGSYGLGASLDQISFVEKLSNRLTFVYYKGNNSARGIRNAKALSASYMTMGHDLTTDEYMVGLNFDTKYMIYENLSAILETGWAHGEFQESVWGHRLYQQAQSNGNNIWKLGLGLVYKF